MKRYVLVRGVPGRFAPHPNIKIGETGGQPQRPLGMRRNYEATKAEEMWAPRDEVVEFTHAVRKLIRGGDVEQVAEPAVAESPAAYRASLKKADAPKTKKAAPKAAKPAPAAAGSDR